MFKRAVPGVLVLLLVMLMTPLGGTISAQPAYAAVADRECADTASENPTREALCVNGSAAVPVRGPDSILACLLKVDIRRNPAGSRFPQKTCTEGTTIQAEKIAQARLIQWLDARDRVDFAPTYSNPGSPGVLEVHPGVQWEIATSYTPAKFADVLNYEPDYSGRSDPSTRPMSLWELKTSVSYGSHQEAAKSASSQADAYRKTLSYERVPNKNDPNSLSVWNSLALATNQGYSDSFIVEKRTCKERDAKTAIDQEFTVREDGAFAGALIAERTVKEYKCTNGQRENDASKTEAPYEANRWWLRFNMPAQDLEPVDPNTLILIPAWICAVLPFACAPANQPVRRETVLTRAALLRTDQPASAYWQEQNAAFCEAIAEIERTRGAGSAPRAEVCRASASFSAVLADTGVVTFLTSLDSTTFRHVMEQVWTWVGRDGANNVSTPARVTGDPHLVTLDGLNYDMQSVGEFDLLAVPDRGVQVQARFAAAGTQSSIVALATEWGGARVEMHADGGLLVNGKPVTLAPGEGVTPGEGESGYLVNDEGTYRLSWESDVPGEAPVVLSWQAINANLGGFGAQVPPGVGTVGLLGNNDGNALNDVVTRQGESIDATNAVAVHDVYADSWRIRSELSDFTYAAGQSTSTFTDRSFPQQIVTTGDFPIADQVTAQKACESAGVVSGPAFRNCVLDVLVTRNADFARAFIGAQDPVRSAGDTVMTSTGRLTESFGAATITPNLRPLRVTSDAGFGNVAGPFGGAEQYRFYVPDLPRHDQVTVSFDLIAVGQWDTADAVAVRIDGLPAQALDLTGATPGVLSTTIPIRTKRITVPVDHFSDLVSVALAGSGLDGTQRFAIDNVEVAARLVAPQSFSPVLAPGLTVALRQPTLAAGSGVLESWGARDAYTVTAAHQDLLLDWQTRSDTIKWTLTDATGSVTAGGLSSDGNTRLRDLNGSYTVTIEAAGTAPPTSETYSLDLLATPEAQQFSFELPGPVRLPADLPSPAVTNGAGALETKLSTDVYAFTVVNNDRTVTIDPVSCPIQAGRQRLSWTLLNSTGVLIDSGSCWSRTVTGLAAGAYTLRVEPEREATGTYEITVTQAGATASFSTPPPDATNQRTQNVSFVGSSDAAGFECALDAPSYTGPFTACSSPKTFANLADGDHTIRVRATDADGNRGPAISHTMTVDTAVPNVLITRKPPAQSNINGPVLEYSAEKRGMSYQCSLVPVGSAPQLSPCTGVSVYRDLAHGTYRFTVLGTDWVGNQSTVSYDFMVDLEPPVITLTPASNLTSTTTPQFTFTANETVTYQCSLVPTAQADAFSPCTSPKQYSGLTDGTQYRFFVKATDVAGQWSARGVTWTPYSIPPTVTLTSKPAASSTNAAPSFAFASTMTNPTFECSLELAAAATAYSTCTSPKAYTGKTPGSYKFTVKATDSTGSWVSTSYQFTITAPSGDTQAPTTPGTPSAVIALAGATLGADNDTPAAGIPLRISWTGSTDNIGVTGYQLWYSTNGAPYVNAGNIAGTSVNMNVPPGTSTWRFQIKAYDAAGNLSTATAASAAATVAIEQDTASSRLVYTGTWTNGSAIASSGGTTHYASTSTATATYKPATGTTQVALVMPVGPAAGRATISVDGGTATTVDLYAPTAGNRSITLSTANLSATTAHTIIVKPTGTKNASSTGTRVDLDAFITRK